MGIHKPISYFLGCTFGFACPLITSLTLIFFLDQILVDLFYFTLVRAHVFITVIGEKII